MRSFIVLLLILLFISCTNPSTGEESFLSEPPYAGISDSIRQSPTNAALYYRRAQLLYGANQDRHAEKDLRQAWKLQPREDHALSLATVLREKHPDSAILFLQQAALQLPESIAVRIALARGYQQQGAPDKALSLTGNILQQFPNQLDALLLQAEIFREGGRRKEALAALQEAYSYAPGDPELAHTLAYEYAISGHPRTLALCDSLIRADTESSHAEPHYFKGLYFAGKGLHGEAIRHFDAAIRNNYYFINAYINKGMSYYEGKDWKRAADVFRLAIRISPTEADAYYWLGKTDEAAGRKAEAKANYQRAAGLDKTHAAAREAAARL